MNAPLEFHLLEAPDRGVEPLHAHLLVARPTAVLVEERVVQQATAGYGLTDP